MSKQKQSKRIISTKRPKQLTTPKAGSHAPRLVSKTTRVAWTQQQKQSGRRNAYINDPVFGSEGVPCKKGKKNDEGKFVPKTILTKKDK